MRKSIIAEHIKYNWPLYAVLVCFLGFIILIAVILTEKQRRAEACLDRGMVVVNTSAGGRCAAPNSLERI
jgi:hypothetical protein